MTQAATTMEVITLSAIIPVEDDIILGKYTFWYKNYDKVQFNITFNETWTGFHIGKPSNEEQDHLVYIWTEGIDPDEKTKRISVINSLRTQNVTTVSIEVECVGLSVNVHLFGEEQIILRGTQKKKEQRQFVK